MVKIVDSLERIVRETPDLHSIQILDKDGIPVVSAGEEIRSRDMLSSCLTSAIEQAKKLGMGNQKWWTFLYKGHQVVMLNLEPFYAFMFAATSAETGVLCNLADKLQPILNECEQLFKDILMIST